MLFTVTSKTLWSKKITKQHHFGGDPLLKKVISKENNL